MTDDVTKWRTAPKLKTFIGAPDRKQLQENDGVEMALNSTCESLWPWDEIDVGKMESATDAEERDVSSLLSLSAVGQCNVGKWVQATTKSVKLGQN